MDDLIFAGKLKAARRLLRLSQAEVGAAIGLAQKDISNIENGTRQYIPIQYISFLQKKGIDIRMLYDLSKESVGFADKGDKINYSDAVGVDDAIRQKKSKEEDMNLPISQSSNVDLNSRPKSRPISKSKNLGLQNTDLDNVPVEIVDVRAAANVSGLSMVEGYVEILGVMPVPRNLILRTRDSKAKFLWFPTIGDSMEPTIYIGDYILASQVVDYSSIKDNYIYIISTRENGILIKRVLNRLESRGQLYARSDNRSYSSFNIDEPDIVSVWEARAKLSFKFPNEQINLYNKYTDLDARIEQLEEYIKRNVSKK